jgi:phosphatidylinositol alpha-1,6-mannosyltransferase
LRAAYHLADLFVMPNIPVQNDIEGFGLVALEAAAAGRYVVASRLDGIPEAIVPGQNGTLLDPLDSEAFASSILHLLADDRKRIALGLKAREFVERHYSWDIIARKYQQVFMRVVQAQQSPRRAAAPPAHERSASEMNWQSQDGVAELRSAGTVGVSEAGGSADQSTRQQ